MQARLRRGIDQWFAVLLFLSTLIPRVFADVEFLTPQAGVSYSATTPLTVTWQDSGAVPTFTDLSTASMKLCGMSDPSTIYCQQPENSFIFQGQTLSGLGGTYSAVIPVAMGANGQYFLQMTSIIAAGGYVVNYSDRFNLTGMTGAMEFVYIDNTDGPARQYDPATTPTSSTSDLFLVSYPYQDGWATKFAPMQRQPGTTVTASTASRRFPTSAISAIFKTNTLQPYAQSTVTLSWDYTPTSVINGASPQPNPSANGGSYEANKKKKKRWDD
ncbi:uncharacterized protein V1513DRAFT_476942 [Lipomyces chichibuensis]|uniref:uncharacterized protein n=1 Tax=Lipomyces chichibuensis TaxID=1546026 RepID=UPI003343841A